MANLTEDQIQFLNRHGVSLEKTLDATGLSRSYYQELMTERCLEVAYGVSPCAKGNHTLRTRAGSIQNCNGAKSSCNRISSLRNLTGRSKELSHFTVRNFSRKNSLKRTSYIFQAGCPADSGVC